MNSQLPSIGSALALTLCAKLAVANSQPSDDEQLLKAFNAQGYQIVYQDEQHQPLSASALEQLLREGLEVSGANKDESQRTLTLTVKARQIVDHSLSNQPLPPIKGFDQQGNPVIRALDTKRHTLLSFYFAMCKPCVAEVPMLNAFAKAHPEIELIGVTFDEPKTNQAFIRQRGLEIETIAGAYDYINSLGLRGYPTLMLVNPDGKVIAQRTGGEVDQSPEEMLKELENWLNKQLKAPS